MYDERSFERAAREYRRDFGIYPLTDANSTWSEKLIEAQFVTAEQMSQGDSSTQPVDPWGTPYVYVPPPDPRADPDDQSQGPRIGSFGANGVDDGGKGDDLWSDQDVNDGFYCYRKRPQMWRWLWFFGAGLVAWIVVLVHGPKRRWALVLLLPAYFSIAYIVCAPLSHSEFWRPTFHSFRPWRFVYGLSWGVLLATAAAPMLLAAVRAARAWGRPVGACENCSYSLDGLPESVRVCPECGTERALHERPEPASDSARPAA